MTQKVQEFLAKAKENAEKKAIEMKRAAIQHLDTDFLKNDSNFKWSDKKVNEYVKYLHS